MYMYIKNKEYGELYMYVNNDSNNTGNLRVLTSVVVIRGLLSNMSATLFYKHHTRHLWDVHVH